MGAALVASKTQCRLPRYLDDGTRVPAFEKRRSTGETRPVVAVIEGRDIDKVDPRKKFPWQGLLLIPLDGAPAYTDDMDSGTWHYVLVFIEDTGALYVREVKWPETHGKSYLEDVNDRSLPWDFADDDGVETLHVHYTEDVDFVVPVHFIPDERELRA